MSKVIKLVKHGPVESAFQIEDADERLPREDEVGIEVEAFGLNFADILIRLGKYPDCPNSNIVIGYEAVGRIKHVGKNRTDVKIGQRIAAITHFGAYSNYIVQNPFAIIGISEEIDSATALSLIVHYSTAYYITHVTSKVFKYDKILIHSAASGVGIALIQLCKLLDAEIYATSGNAEKLAYLENVVELKVIDYNKENWSDSFKNTFNFIYDSVGGSIYKKYFSLLKKSGTIISYGSNSLLSDDENNSSTKIQMQYGIYHPLILLSESKSLIGVNLLQIGLNKPKALQYCLEKVFELYASKKIAPVLGKMFPVSALEEAHKLIEQRNHIGKVSVYW